MAPKRQFAGMMEVQIEGDDTQVRSILQHLDSTLNPFIMAPWMEQTLTPWFQERGRMRFQEEGDDASGKWLPLKPATHKFRIQAQVGAAHPINRRTGELENYITNGAPGFAHPNTLGVTFTFPGKPPIGELKDKVETAQRGRDYPGTDPRPVLAINERDLLAVMTDLALYLSVGQFK